MRAYVPMWQGLSPRIFSSDRKRRRFSTVMRMDLHTFDKIQRATLGVQCMLAAMDAREDWRQLVGDAG